MGNFNPILFSSSKINNMILKLPFRSSPYNTKSTKYECRLKSNNVDRRNCSKIVGDDKFVTIKWKLKNGSVIATNSTLESNLMRVAHANNIDLEGACEGVCACSTCHIILEPSIYNLLPDASEEEEDMLDQAFGKNSF